MLKDGFTYKELLSLSLSEQVSLIAEWIFDDCLPSHSFHAYENLFLICEYHEIAMAVSAIVGMAGCLSRIEQHETSDAEQSYIVRIAPVSHQSSLNQLLLALYKELLKEHPEEITMWDGNPSPLSLKTFYKQNLAVRSLWGVLPFGIPLLSDERQREAISHLCGKADSGSALKALESAFTRDGLSVPFADPVAQVWRMMPQPLYDLNIPKVHAFSANGLIVHNTTLARVFAKAVNCGKRNGDACGECVHCLTHTNPHEYDSSLIGRVDAVRALREDLRSRHVGGYRTVIFDEAQTSSREAQAALLPLVEEPPQDTFFVFRGLSLGKHKMPVRGHFS